MNATVRLGCKKSHTVTCEQNKVKIGTENEILKFGAYFGDFIRKNVF